MERFVASYFLSVEAYDWPGNIVRFNPNTTIDTTFNTHITDTIRAPITHDVKLLSSGEILISGDFTSFASQKHIRLAKLNSSGSLITSFNPSASSLGTVSVIKRQNDGKILIGGDFAYVNGIPRTGLARLNNDGSLDESFDMPSTFTDIVSSIAASD